MGQGKTKTSLAFRGSLALHCWEEEPLHVLERVTDRQTDRQTEYILLSNQSLLFKTHHFWDDIIVRDAQTPTKL
jgi:hypothetical protein